jgi:hypothetical protein
MGVLPACGGTRRPRLTNEFSTVGCVALSSGPFAGHPLPQGERLRRIELVRRSSHSVPAPLRCRWPRSRGMLRSGRPRALPRFAGSSQPVRRKFGRPDWGP